MDNQKGNSKATIEYGVKNLKDIVSDILVNYIGEEKHDE